MSASWLFSTPCSKLNHHIYHQRVTSEKEIKKSKFIAIAGHIPDERSAQSFLSEVRDPRATHSCWAYKVGEQ
ncbi:hypothetical protein K7X08_003111 [Anisodus acutangulus]|uniref:Impact N-terminal domain-containing protein n=1 Tax=Anisodus acutangulus TaxID=402998 RepID=A0A9Q1MD83_9SOLA|nr:hypothetical protein K7X08_003111 [Anisodus acutangulus]